MIVNLNPYPEYKNPCLPWLESCPSHWFLIRPKSIFNRMQRPVCPGDDVVTCFRDGVVTLRKNRRLSGFTESIKEIGYQGIRKGDLVIHAMDAFAGAIGVSDSDGKGTPVYAVCRPLEKANAYYYAFILREMSRSHYLLSLAKGIRERSTDFRYADFASLTVPLPPLDEQEAIVRFIRHLDHRVNRLIKAKRRLIELLNEQKQAIIHRTITRGLDPNAPMKPSGIEWLGDIPVHWEVLGNRSLFTERRQAGLPDLPLLEVSLHTGVRVAAELDHFGRPRKEIEDRTKYQLARQGDIAYNMMRMWQGAVGVVPEDGLISPAYVVARPDHRLNSHFAELIFRTPVYMGAVNRSSKGIVSDRNRLYWDDFKQLPLWLPPRHEQEAILTFLLNETTALRKVFAKTSAEIDLLREYRTRLVADVVTGQLDIRDVAVTLPDETTEPEPFDFMEDAEETDTEKEETEI